MGFTAKTVCPECGLVTEQHFEGNGFNEKNRNLIKERKS